MTGRGRGAFTIIELLVVVSIIAVLLAMLMPAIGAAHDLARVNASKSNLRQMAAAHKAYAADWSDRQVTYVRDDLGRFGGDLQVYNASLYGQSSHSLRYFLHPGIVAGLGWIEDGSYIPWAYWSTQSSVMFQPISFPGQYSSFCPSCTGWGWFRFGVQPKSFNQYLSNRWHDPVFYAPKDRVILEPVEQCFEAPGEFVGGEGNGGIGPPSCNPGWGSYCMSPAALYSPKAFADDGQGRFWSAPWAMPDGYRVPSFGQSRYPSLKTHMLEHHWLQGAKVPCNGAFLGCEPYYFNHSFQSTPVTLFYDGSIRLMGVMEAMSSDRRHQAQAGYGLWSRDTPFGGGGYFGEDGYDYASTSFHILTIDGARGRDTLGSE